MPLVAGTRLGPYEILSLLGAGGMGEVYRAKDSRLQRDVALKILHAEVASNPDRRARFEREARAVAALSHPNIVALYDIGEDAGRLYMVSELVTGETLRDRLRNGALTVRETLDLAVQIADGIAAAHKAGITHRDLKPENLIISSTKTIKILDFGLARLESDSTAEKAVASDATLTVQHHTQPGMVMGTPHYMSPEQARGLATDYRSDQFSFGVIIHEMLTGKPAFRRATIPETMVAILREEAAPLDAAVPAPLRWIVERTLAKDPEDRYVSTADLYRDLRSLRDRLAELTSSVTSGANFPAIAHPSAKRRTLRPWLVAAACLLAGAALALLLAPSSGDDESRYRFTALSRNQSSQLDPRWSPDSKSVVYRAVFNGVSQICVRAVDAPNAAQLTHGPSNCYSPFWSPDGATIYYLSQGACWSMSASGGAPQKAFSSASAAALHPDGKTFAVARNGKLFIGPANESEQKEYHDPASPSAAEIRDLQFSPDGSRLAVAANRRTSENGQLDLWILPLRSGGAPQIELTAPRLDTVSWFPDSRRLLFQRDDGDNSSVVILDTQTHRTRVVWQTPSRLPSCSVSPDGKRIAIATGDITSEVTEVTLPGGRVTSLQTLTGNLSSYPDWAPSGTHYLHTTTSPAAIQDHSVTEGFVRTLVSKQSDVIPPNAVAFQEPRWSPDGLRFVFVIGFGGGSASRQLWVSNLSAGRPFPLSGAPIGWGPSWSPDGEWISFLSSEAAGKPGVHLFKIRVSAGASPVLLADDMDSTIGGSHWSPAGDWILYVGRSGLSLVSPDGKTNRVLTPRRMFTIGFSRHGDQVFGIFRDARAQIPAWQLFSIDTRSGVEKQLATLDISPDVFRVSNFSLHPDGSRFAVSVDRSRDEIYMLEGFDASKSWLERFLRR